MDPRCNALERDCIGEGQGGGSAGSVSWRPFRRVTGTEREIFGRPPDTADRNERGSRSGSEFRSHRPVLQSRNGIVTAETATRPPTHFTVGVVHRVYYTKNAISSWWWDFHSVEIVRTGWPFQRFYVSACIGACNRWIAQLRAQSGSRSLGRAGRASGTRLIRSIWSFYDRFFVVISEIGIVIF